jgi:hypothetical protein
MSESILSKYTSHISYLINLYEKCCDLSPENAAKDAGMSLDRYNQIRNNTAEDITLTEISYLEGCFGEDILGTICGKLVFTPSEKSNPPYAGEYLCLEKYEHTHVGESGLPIFKRRIIIHYWIDDVKIWARTPKEKVIVGWCRIPFGLANHQLNKS